MNKEYCKLVETDVMNTFTPGVTIHHDVSESSHVSLHWK